MIAPVVVHAEAQSEETSAFMRRDPLRIELGRSDHVVGSKTPQVEPHRTIRIGPIISIHLLSDNAGPEDALAVPEGTTPSMSSVVPLT